MLVTPIYALVCQVVSTFRRAEGVDVTALGSQERPHLHRRLAVGEGRGHQEGRMLGACGCISVCIVLCAGHVHAS